MVSWEEVTQVRERSGLYFDGTQDGLGVNVTEYREAELTLLFFCQYKITTSYKFWSVGVLGFNKVRFSSKGDFVPCLIQDMLVFLYLEGPYTKGVFRRSAGAKACRELRDRLDNGTDVPEIKHQPVFVIAAVLKVTSFSSPRLFEATENTSDWCVSGATVGQEASQAHKMNCCLGSRLDDCCRGSLWPADWAFSKSIF